MNSFNNENGKKTIIIKNIEDNTEKELEVLLSMTVFDLKREIERMFNLKNGFLNDYILKCKYRGMRSESLMGKDNSTLFDNHIRNYCLVSFGKVKNLGGGGPMNFTDVSKGNTIDLDFSSDAPSYRTAGKGINIFGICKCKNCKSKGNEVVCIVNKKKIDLTEEKFNITCPECSSIIEPKTVGFYLCKYRIYGEKIENKTIVDFDSGVQEANDKNNLKYYDQLSNGEAKFNKIIFEVIEYY